MAGVEDDSNLVQDMMNVEAHLGQNILRLLSDNHILDLLILYSGEEDRVQKVVNELRRTYMKEDLSLYMDEGDDDVLLALDSPFLNPPRLNIREQALMAQNAPGPSTNSPIATSSTDVSSSSSPISSPESEVSMREPVLQPAKLNVMTEALNPPIMNQVPVIGDPPAFSSSEEQVHNSFDHHRYPVHDRESDDSSSSNTDNDSEPEIIPINEEYRKRRKLQGGKSPGKKTKVEVVDLVSSSPSSTLDSSEYLSILQAMFPDADQNFLRDKFKHVDNEQELNVMAAGLLEANDYPRIASGE